MDDTPTLAAETLARSLRAVQRSADPRVEAQQELDGLLFFFQNVSVSVAMRVNAVSPWSAAISPGPTQVPGTQESSGNMC